MTLLENIRRAMGISNTAKSRLSNDAPYEHVVHNTQDYAKRSSEQLTRLYTSLVEVRIIEDYIATAVTKIPIKIMRGETEIKNSNALSRLKQRANPSQTLRALTKQLLTYYGITGNLYALHSSNYLYALPSHKMEVVLALGVDIPEYLNFIANYVLTESGAKYSLEEPNILHMKTTQLKSDNSLWTLGTSPYSSAIPNLEALEANYRSRVSMLADRGALGILTNRSQIPSKESTEEVQDALLDYGIQPGQRKYIATPEDLQWVQMSLNVEELQLLQQGTADFGKLCEVRGVDSNIFSADTATYDNQYAAIESTFRRAIIPTAEQFYEELRVFTEYHFNGLYFKPELEYLSEMSDTQTKQSLRIMNEVTVGALTKEQGLAILYPDLKFEGTEDDDLRRQGLQAVRAAGGSAGGPGGAGRGFADSGVTSANGNDRTQGGSGRRMQN